MHRIGTVERAFQIASESATLDEVKKRLASEGYSNIEAHLTGPQIRRQLTVLLNSEPRGSTAGG